MIDTLDLKRSVDLLSLVGRDTRLKKQAGTRGGEYAGPCPFCGGRDRFRVQPEKGLWWCRNCSPDSHWQDAIAYVRQRDNVDFVEACRTLGAVESTPHQSVNHRGKQAVPTSWDTSPDDPEPTPAWRKAAAEVVERCKDALWSDPEAKARRWLNDRGLTDDTLAIWELGHNGRDQRIAGLWVPRGIVIPWFVDGELWQLKVRRPPGCEPKYLSVTGGHPLLYGTVASLEGYEAAVLVEGEFDCLLLWQECRDLVAVVTLGSSNKALTPRAMRYLLPVPRLLIAYDIDERGEEGAARLLELSARMTRIRPLVAGEGKKGRRTSLTSGSRAAGCATGLSSTSCV